MLFSSSNLFCSAPGRQEGKQVSKQLTGRQVDGDRLTALHDLDAKSNFRLGKRITCRESCEGEGSILLSCPPRFYHPPMPADGLVMRRLCNNTLLLVLAFLGSFLKETLGSPLACEPGGVRLDDYICLPANYTR